METHPTEPTRVLIVDDVTSVRQQLALLLWLSGSITVIGSASDGLQAVRLAEALHPDVVLMDLELPLLDGCEAARRIKARLPGCRVIALTIHDSPESRARCKQAGMDAFLSKGTSSAVLLQAIHHKGQAVPEEGE